MLGACAHVSSVGRCARAEGLRALVGRRLAHPGGGEMCREVVSSNVGCRACGGAPARVATRAANSHSLAPPLWAPVRHPQCSCLQVLM